MHLDRTIEPLFTNDFPEQPGDDLRQAFSQLRSWIVLLEQMMEVNKLYKDHRKDHLLLLVGTNPLPVYVSARLLAGDNTKIHWIITQEIIDREIYKHLLEQLGLSDAPELRVTVNPSDPYDIRTKVTAHLSELSGSWGLNYTGGTKAMAVHAHAAVKAAAAVKNTECEFSYLDAGTLEMVFEKPERTIRLPAHRKVTVSIEQMLALHGLVPEEEMRSYPFQPDFCNKFLQYLHDNTALNKWNDFKREEQGLFKAPDPIFNPEIPIIGGKTLSWLAQNWGDSIRGLPGYMYGVENGHWKNEREFLRNWLGGSWLEDYVYIYVQPLVQERLLDQAVINLHIRGKKLFEVDIAATQGYRLFVLSISTVSAKPMSSDVHAKLKLFEALERALQMGGEEARVGMVTFTRNNDYLADQLASQLSLESDPDKAKQVIQKRNLRVFGWHDLLDLEDQLRDWFKEV